MSPETTDPHYSTLSQSDLDTLTDIVSRFGYTAIISGVADILHQKIGSKNAILLSFDLGIARASAEDVDKRFPPGD